MTQFVMEKKYQPYVLTGLLALFFCYVMVWVVTIPFDGAPDEELRYLVPQYIYRYADLPTGYHPEVIYHEGFYSYAFYPQLLGALLSAGFMWLGQVLTFGQVELFHLARLTSVCCGLGVSYLLGKTSYRLTGSFAMRLFTMSLVIAWPQLTFLSAYINNDIVGLLGAVIVSDGMVKLWKEQAWRVKDTLWVAMGYVICLLGYVNTYPLVLFSGLYFLMMLLRLQLRDKRSVFWTINHCLLLLLILLVLAFPFFLRNYLLYQDWLGNRVFEARNQEWLSAGHPPTLFPFQNGNFWDMVQLKAFWKSMVESFIGVFGYMSIGLAPELYSRYLWLILLGSGLSLGVFSWRLVAKKGKMEDVVLILTSLLTSLLTIFLVLYRSFKTDYQAQGRYVIVLIIPLILLAIIGYHKVLSRLPKLVRVSLVVLLTLLILQQSLAIYQDYIYHSYVELGLSR